jgi:hypothetical protein
MSTQSIIRLIKSGGFWSLVITVRSCMTHEGKSVKLCKMQI